MYAAPGGGQGGEAVAGAAAFDEGGDLRFALPVLHHDVYDTHGQHSMRLVNLATADQLVGGLLSHAAFQEGIGAHAREQIEQDFGKTEARACFGDNDVARQGALEAAAHAFALDQRYGGGAYAVTHVIAVQHVHAGQAVMQQGLAVPRLDQLGEQAEIAAEIENAGYLGGEHGVFHGMGVRAMGNAAFGGGHEIAIAPQVIQQFGIEAGAGCRVPGQPHAIQFRLETRRKLV